MNHRNSKWEKYIGKRVRVSFADGDIITGLLNFDDERQFYKLTNCMGKKGFLVNDTLFRKSHVKEIEVTK